MSRARPFHHDNEIIWFDQHSRATVNQLELLADYEDIDVDDLLDASLTQKQVLFRLRQIATPEVIPAHVLVRRRERERLRGMQLACRICVANGWECEGIPTKHHYVPRWVMVELSNYQLYASRLLCTIPLCLGRHRDLHQRNDVDKSIIPYLQRNEGLFAQGMLEELQDERPKIFQLLAEGDFHSYESQLVHDYLDGRLLEACYDLDHADDQGQLCTQAGGYSAGARLGKVSTNL